jgi:hypothetical protein
MGRGFRRKYENYAGKQELFTQLLVKKIDRKSSWIDICIFQMHKGILGRMYLTPNPKTFKMLLKDSVPTGSL